jgi:hypothetical protein
LDNPVEPFGKVGASASTYTSVPSGIGTIVSTAALRDTGTHPKQHTDACACIPDSDIRHNLSVPDIQKSHLFCISEPRLTAFVFCIGRLGFKSLFRDQRVACVSGAYPRFCNRMLASLSKLLVTFWGIFTTPALESEILILPTSVVRPYEY